MATLDKDIKAVEHLDNDLVEKGSRLGDEDNVVQSLPVPESLASLSEAQRKKIEKRATFKLDCVILTGVVIMVCCWHLQFISLQEQVLREAVLQYILNYLDRQNISAARLAGIQEDLNLSDVQYQTAVSILFVGYVSCRSFPFRSQKHS